jgi:uncharacterized protein (TIGR02145 family)
MYTIKTLFTGIAVAFFLMIATCMKDPTGPGPIVIIPDEPVTDIDGNVYQTVRIGNQVWTVENLRTTKYNDGSAILLVTNASEWYNLSTPGYCYYNNTTNTDSIRKFGALYNWYTVNPSNSKKVAPAGWHVPTDVEWDILRNYLIAIGYNWDETTEDNKIAKSMAAKTDWVTNTRPGTIGCDLTKNNKSGFSALPGGFRYYDGTFYYQSTEGCWWSATASDATYTWYRFLGYDNVDLFRYFSNNGCGYSVRLVRGSN